MADIKPCRHNPLADESYPCGICFPPEAVHHPAHYGGGDNPYEAIKVIEAWELGFNLGNAVKYISRAGRKDRAKEIEDLKKARWYLDRQIETRVTQMAQASLTAADERNSR